MFTEFNLTLSLAFATLILSGFNVANYAIGKYIFKLKAPGALFCGLFGYCGDVPANPDKIKILGLFNQDRGEDSCGISVDDIVYKGIGVDSKWNKFIQTIKLDSLIENTTENNTIIGHCRKSTIGAHTKENAHPFEIFKDPNDTDPTLIFAHNGQIRNWVDLCKEYGVDTKPINVDSLGLGSILAKDKENIKVFKEYKGFGAFMFYVATEAADKDQLYIFKGSSKEYTNGITKEERPLFYWQVPDANQVYVSSLKEALLAIGGDEETVKPFETNKLILIKKGKFVALKDKIANLDRSEVVAENFTTKSSSSGGTNCYNRYSTDSCSGKSSKKSNIKIDWEDLEAAMRGEPKGHLYEKGNTTDEESGKRAVTCCSIDENSKETSETVLLGGFKRLNSPEQNLVKDVPNEVIDEEPFEGIYNPILMPDQVYFHRGRYKLNGNILGSGFVMRMMLDNKGVSVAGIGHNSTSAKEYVFFNGFMCKSVEAAEELLKASQDMTKNSLYTCTYFHKTKEVRSLNCGFIASRLASGWAHSFNSPIGDAHDPETGKVITGVISPLFSHKHYEFLNGTLRKIHEADIQMADWIENTNPNYNVELSKAIIKDYNEHPDTTKPHPFKDFYLINGTFGKMISPKASNEEVVNMEEEMIPFVPNVPQEEPTDEDFEIAKKMENQTDETLERDEMILTEEEDAAHDLFLDTTNDITKAIEKLKELGKKNPSKKISACQSRLEKAREFLVLWYDNSTVSFSNGAGLEDEEEEEDSSSKYSIEEKTNF